MDFAERRGNNPKGLPFREDCGPRKLAIGDAAFMILRELACTSLSFFVYKLVMPAVIA